MRSETRIPFLGDLPLIGVLFREKTVDATRNELIITVTPHVIDPGQPQPTLPPEYHIGPPSPAPLPTIPVTASLPPARHGFVVARRPSAAATPSAAPSPTPTPLQIPGSLGSPPPFGIAGPNPTPTAFGQTNTFTYGSPPANNYAAPGDALQIFYATFSPTVVHNNGTVTVTAITTSNVDKVTVGTSGGVLTQLSAVNSGQWQATYNFNTAGLQTNAGPIPVVLTASSSSGAQTRINIPVSISP